MSLIYKTINFWLVVLSEQQKKAEAELKAKVHAIVKQRNKGMISV